MKRVICKNSSSSSSTSTTISGLLLLLVVSCASLAIVGLINSAADVVLHDSTTTMSRELSTEKLSAKKVELHTDDIISDSTNNNSNHGPTFVFIIGIEGTGHHFIYELLSKTPNKNVV